MGITPIPRLKRTMSTIATHWTLPCKGWISGPELEYGWMSFRTLMMDRMGHPKCFPPFSIFMTRKAGNPGTDSDGVCWAILQSCSCGTGNGFHVGMLWHLQCCKEFQDTCDLPSELWPNFIQADPVKKVTKLWSIYQIAQYKHFLNSGTLNTCTSRRAE